ncbi:MAG: hypothetical protein QXV52_05990 [Nitrososphaeria archaeon]
MILSEQVYVFAIIVLSFALILASYFAYHFYKKSITRQTKAFESGESRIKGELAQIIGTFAFLQEYDQLIFLSTTSKQSSLDLIGIKEDSLDFIEIKSKGSGLSPSERKVRKLIEEKKVNYVIKEVEIPNEIKINTRK